MAVRYFEWRAAAPVLSAALIALSACVVAPMAARAAAPPDGRGYELVSPPDKNGGDILQWSLRTHASNDGNAVGFASLVGFADAMGTGVTVDYLAQRRPGANGGWSTHALTPVVPSGSINTRGAVGDTIFEAFSPDLGSGILESATPVVSDDNVRDVGNLYRRDDVARAGAGSYELMTGCPACVGSGTPLPPVSGIPAILQSYLPRLAGTSPDMQHASFESIYDLTSDAPAQTGFCGDANLPPFPPPSPSFCATRLYESDGGQIRLAGILPDGTAADMSVAGGGALLLTYTPHVVSDGSDGHTRVMFTQPTADDGSTFSELDPFGQLFLVLGLPTGNLFMRVDHSQTVQINASERTIADSFAPARYLDASTNGERVFFMTSQALTDDASPGNQQVYLYDAAAAPNHLTLVSRPGAQDFLGASDDGHYAYMKVGSRIVMWHDGTIRDIAEPPFEAQNLVSADANWGQNSRESRVTPDGRHFLIVSDRPPAPGGYDHGTCSSGFGCHELYVYSADDNTWQCASCNPSGATATVNASVVGAGALGGALGTPYLNHAMSTDGTFVFFNSQEALVPDAQNGKVNAYEFNTSTDRVALLSSGTSPDDSFFLDASASGHDVFIATRDRLVGWDRDSAYDIYDARIGGGFPEPAPTPPACAGGTCQGALAAPPAYASPGSGSFSGSGDAKDVLRPRARRATCRHGLVRRTVRGRRMCVRPRGRGRRTRRARSRAHRAGTTRSGA